MTPAQVEQRVPVHLRKYCVEQDYSRYTPEDQAVWRYVMRQLKTFLKAHAHPAYVEGLEKTGIAVEEIPRISDMAQRLNEFGWSAVPVSGFIPPAAFMEFQANAILPIASDMRTLDHILYTPAPDIVHEAAGHAPILIEKEFSKYLAEYAQVAANAILSDEDLKLYEAIRLLSDVKENPESTKEDIQKCERDLETISQSMTSVSEAAILGRMNWWTAEYGLVGTLEDPKLFGAGLLSSVGESQVCLSSKVKKIPLSLNCIDYSYDITEPQPHLFVTPNFAHLSKVLKELAKTLAFQVGGKLGLERAIQAKTVNSLQLETGLQISGKISEIISDGDTVIFVRLTGPTQLSYLRQELKDHGPAYHKDGYSSPMGPLKSKLDWKTIKKGSPLKLEYASGFLVDGTFESLIEKEGVILGASFSNCTVTRGSQIYFQPEWGTFDLALGEKVVSVFGGPADRKAYGHDSEFKAARVPTRKISDAQQKCFSFYQSIRDFRNGKSQTSLEKLTEDYFENYSGHWLMGVELLELHQVNRMAPELTQKIINQLESMAATHTQLKSRIQDGIKLAVHVGVTA